MIWQNIFFSFVGAMSFAVIFKVPLRLAAYTVTLGVFVRMTFQNYHYGDESSLAAFLIAFAIGVVSIFLSRWKKAPAQAFLIPGVIFLVPGIYIYKAFTAALTDQLFETLKLAFTVLSIAGGISFGLLIAHWIVPSKRPL